MELRRWEDQPAIHAQIRRGWALGSEAFRQELLDAMKERDSEYIAGDEIKQTEEHKARRMLKEELARLKWTVRDLSTTFKGERRKMRIAKRLRKETTMTLKWIAEQLHMGTWTHVANRIYHA